MACCGSDGGFSYEDAGGNCVNCMNCELQNCEQSSVCTINYVTKMILVATYKRIITSSVQALTYKIYATLIQAGYSYS